MKSCFNCHRDVFISLFNGAHNVVIVPLKLELHALELLSSTIQMFTLVDKLFIMMMTHDVVAKSFTTCWNRAGFKPKGQYSAMGNNIAQCKRAQS